MSRTLEDRFVERLEGEWTERELFNVVYGVEEALGEMDRHGITHGCLNLSTILCQGSNFYKITDVSSTTFVRSY